MRARLIGTALLALALAAGVTGCGADSPKPSPIAESPENPLTTNGSVAPAPGQAPTVGGRQGARAFAEYFLSSLNYASDSGDTSTLESTFSNCTGCSRIVEQIKSIYVDGGYSRGGEWKIVSAKLGKTGAAWILRGPISIGEQTVRESADAPKVTDYPANPSADTVLAMQQRSNQWMMLRLEQNP